LRSRLQHIEIQNFKAFRKFSLDVEGRHLLVYGANGSGKSSLYWALYTFLQSAQKPTPSVAKYFDPGDPQNLLNFHEQAEANPRYGEIVLTLSDTQTKNDTRYPIGRAADQTIHGTRQQPAILKADLASDFITYRFFFGFSDFKNSQTFNVWPLFEKEILPFCISATTLPQSPLDWWSKIRSGEPNPSRSRGLGGRHAYDEFERNTVAFAGVLSALVDTVGAKAQEFYDQHFSQGDPARITLGLSVPKKQGTQEPAYPSYDRATGTFQLPVVEFGFQVDGKTITRPQSFLNEAKMTQLALAVRLAASLVNLQDPNNEYLKLLVLDDLLVSLDMSNRMEVVEILLSETFDDYQKIILTHEFGFFQEFRRKVGAGHPDWCFWRLEGDAATAIAVKTEKTDIQKAEEYIHGHNLDEAGLRLRKACEETAKRFLDRDKVVDPTKEFTGLREDLRAARNRILAELPIELYEKVIRSTPDAHRQLVVPPDDGDIDGNAALDAATKGILKCQRKRLRKLLTADHVERLRQIKLIDDVIKCTNRVLNPAAHSGTPPLYEKELQDALDLVRKLEGSLTP
jgi:energy-coupling factor transporter ATP-binding protein EcfA2